MGKKAKARRDAQKRVVDLPPLRREPNWPLLVLSAIGILLSGYLTWTSFAGTSVKGCSAGSGCDIILSSRWATLMGLPTSAWGLLTYLTLAGTAFIKRVDLHWRLAWLVALFGVFYSAYLTTISLTVLDAACPYCLASLAVMTSIFVLVSVQRPATIPNFSWGRLLARTAPIAAALVLILHLHYSGILGNPPVEEDPQARAVALHLTNIGAKFYGASWCPHCQDQKAFFGPSAKRLPYIECSPSGRSGPQAQECQEAKIESYPTWIINGKRLEEVLTVKQLADTSGFQQSQ